MCVCDILYAVSYTAFLSLSDRPFRWTRASTGKILPATPALIRLGRLNRRNDH